jgi:hypothetical protein
MQVYEEIMEKPLAKLFGIIIIANTLSCTTQIATIKANSIPLSINVYKHDDDISNKQLKNIFVNINMRKIPIANSKETVGSYVKKELEKDFDIRSIKYEIVLNADNNLLRENYNNNREYNKTMNITLVDEILGNDFYFGKNYLRGGSILFSIINNENKREIWRGTVNIEQKYVIKSNILPVPESSISDVVDKIISELIADEYLKEIKLEPIP